MTRKSAKQRVVIVKAPAMKAPEVHRRFKLSRLTPNPENPRTISAEGEAALAGSLKRFGLVDPIIANRRTDGRLVVVAGHQRLRLLLADGNTHGLVIIVEVPIRDEKSLSLVLNGHAGRFDQGALELILTDLVKSGEAINQLGLEGNTGFDKAMAKLAEGSGSGGGKRAGAKPTYFEVCVSCKDDTEQQSLYAKLTKDGYSCRVTTY